MKKKRMRGLTVSKYGNMQGVQKRGNKEAVPTKKIKGGEIRKLLPQGKTKRK